ncbi:hypothetical protein D1BOALGB6SA_3224 [Olavius sp. associated proteobacterium Delta 1]|nr:hypothetical protein D1BOALGB6SA_3224 [Olavius sp. associated proteobacterium Delta 1]
MKSKATHTVFILIGIVCIGRFSVAEGCSQLEARRKLPDIPIQRALLQYRNGIETLIIESAADDTKSNNGWIIPLPNQPIEVTKISPGLLKTISLQMQPVVQNKKLFNDASEISSATINIIIILLICLIFMRWGVKGGILPASLYILFVIWYPNYMAHHQKAGGTLAGSSLTADPKVKEKSRKITGNYEISILQPQDSSELNSWLNRNGLSKIQPETAKLIDSFIARHWCFAVAKRNTNSNDGMTTQALMLQFETDRAVYPMRLSAPNGSSFFLELFVVSEQEAVPINYRIKKEYCNFFDFKKIADSGFSSDSVDRKGFIPRTVFVRDREIAHSDASKVMWDGCVVTKFAAPVPIRAERVDIVFKFKKAAPYRKQFISSKAKFDKAYSDTLAVAAVGAIILTIFYRIFRNRWHTITIPKNFLLLALASAAVFVYTCITLGETTQIYTEEINFDRDSSLPVQLLLQFSSYPAGPISNGQQLIEFFNQNGIDNTITNEPIILEDSPGNYIWQQSGDDVTVKYCHRNGLLEFLPIDLPSISTTRSEYNVTQAGETYLLPQ